jgi:hypothetical protein
VLPFAQEYERLNDWNIAEFQRLFDRVAELAAARWMNAAVLDQLLSDNG